MILPSTVVAAGQATTTIPSLASTHSPTHTPGSGHYPENWSSLIGIITAIVGNILISFALNIQRYAHIRLEREWQEKEKSRKRRSASRNASQAKLAAKYRAPRRTDITIEDDEREALDEAAVATESDPLLGAQSTTRSRTRPTLKSTDTTASNSDGEEEAYKQQSYLKSPWWWAGIILMTTGEAGNFLAYGFAPASIVSPLGVVALISNCIIAPILLKERFRWRDGVGVLVAVAGAVTVVASAKSDNPKLGPQEIWKMITRWEFETYLGITVAVIIALTFASNEYGEKSILIDLGLVGLYGGYTALSTKGVASMLSYTLWRAITFPVTYLLVAILVFTAVMQIKYVNRALQRFDATQVIPVQFVMFTLSVILGSAILYRDFERTSSQDASKFIGGCFLTFSGVWLITSGRHQTRDEDDDEDRDPEPEESINLVNGDRYHDELDGVADGAGSSRRSSTVRASSPPIDIDRRISRQETSPPSTPLAKQSLTQHLSYQQTPPTTSVLPDAPSSLISNPWQQGSPGTAGSSPVRPPSAPIARHSTPLLPSEATATPPGASISNPELAVTPAPPTPHTPTRGISDNIVQTTPSTLPPRLRRIGTSERLGSRNSIPGPILASPLSTSLSAMVADLKRGGSIRSTRTVDPEAIARRRESILGIGAYEIDEEQIGEPLDRRRTATDDVPSQARARKSSLSGTLGDLWRGMRGRTGEEDIEQAEERGVEEGGLGRR